MTTMKYDWGHEACQYAHYGTPGIHLETHAFMQSVVDCLLYRDEAGLLIGILNHYNENNPYEGPGAMNVWVKPENQRQGIATELLRRANELWTLSNEHLKYTPDGDAWIESLVQQGKIDPERTRSLE
jgi:GNAT superfamily N-acetyltransferase